MEGSELWVSGKQQPNRATSVLVGPEPGKSATCKSSHDLPFLRVPLASLEMAKSVAQPSVCGKKPPGLASWKWAWVELVSILGLVQPLCTGFGVYRYLDNSPS